MPPRRVLSELAWALTILVAVAAVTAVFLWPWRPRRPPGGPELARYAPQRDGHAALFADAGADGSVRSWESRNVAVVGAGRAGFFEVRTGAALAIARRYRIAVGSNVLDELRARLADVEIAETRRRTLDLDGQVRATAVTSVRDASGDAVIALYDAADDRELVFEPPLPALPASLRVGNTWEGDGQLGSLAAYRIEGQVVEAGPFEGDGARFDDCLVVRTRLAFSQAGRTIQDTTRDDRLCAEVGAVESRELDAAGQPRGRSLLLRARDLDGVEPAAVSVGTGESGANGTTAGSGSPDSSSSLRSQFPPPVPAEPADAPPSGPSGSPDRWVLSALGRSSTAGSVASTVPPRWISASPPLVVAAGYGGDLVAFDADDPTGTIVWRFHPEGTIYGAPSFDSERGVVYFGASDRRVYALDVRGLFLWSFRAGDNVAARPLPAGELVVVGSEDGAVYGLEAGTGALRWRTKVGGPVVSAPALAGEPGAAVVVVGSDDGSVYGLDAATGDERWQYAIGGAVEAPVAVADGRAYVTSHSGAVAALDPADGTPVWKSSVSASGRAASLLPAARTAPTIGLGLVLIVDNFGVLVALDQEDGRLHWITPEPDFVGPSVLADDGIVVARKDGGVSRFDRDGRRLEAWTQTVAAGASMTGRPPGFELGATVGGGAIWLADDRANVRRLGPPMAGPPLLATAWTVSASTPPFDRNILSLAAAEYEGRAVVVDGSAGVSLIDPATGVGVRAGRLGADGAPASVDPVVAGNVLLAVVGEALQAARLPDLRPLWSIGGAGRPYRPPAVEGDAVAWLSQPADAGGGGAQVTLQVADLATGALRWQAPLDGAQIAGGAVARDGVLYVSTPPSAFDLATGLPRWQVEVSEPTLGGPALSPAGDTLLVVAAAGAGGNAHLLALDGATGGERWRADLGQVVPSIREAPWASADAVILATFSGEVVALDAATGTPRWRYKSPTTRYGGITVADGRVLFALETGQLVVLDAASGTLVARSARLDGSYVGGTLGARPTPIGSKVVIPLGSALVGVALDGIASAGAAAP